MVEGTPWIVVGCAVSLSILQNQVNTWWQPILRNMATIDMRLLLLKMICRERRTCVRSLQSLYTHCICTHGGAVYVLYIVATCVHT